MFTSYGITCLLAVEAETGWLLPRYRRCCEIIRLWHRLVNMDTNGLTHNVFLWYLHLTEHYRNTWCGDVKTEVQERDLFNVFNTDLSRTISTKNLVEHVKQKLICVDVSGHDSVLQSANISDIQILDW